MQKLPLEGKAEGRHEYPSSGGHLPGTAWALFRVGTGRRVSARSRFPPGGNARPSMVIWGTDYKMAGPLLLPWTTLEGRRKTRFRPTFTNDGVAGGVGRGRPSRRGHAVPSPQTDGRAEQRSVLTAKPRRQAQGPPGCRPRAAGASQERSIVSGIVCDTTRNRASQITGMNNGAQQRRAIGQARPGEASERRVPATARPAASAEPPPPPGAWRLAFPNRPR
jgi:hypothetical protein